MAISFEEYVDRMNKARSVDELLQIFLETVGQHGYDKMIFCLLSDHKQIGLAAGVGHLRNYPADWMQYYFEQRFDRSIPSSATATRKWAPSRGRKCPKGST